MSRRLWLSVLAAAKYEAAVSSPMGAAARGYLAFATPDLVAVADFAGVPLGEGDDEAERPPEDGWMEQMERRFRASLPGQNRAFVAHFKERLAGIECLELRDGKWQEREGCVCAHYLSEYEIPKEDNGNG